MLPWNTSARKSGAVLLNLSKRIRRLQGEGVYQEKLSPEVVSHFLIGMVDEIALSYLQKGRKADLEWLADQCASFELDGLLRRR